MLSSASRVSSTEAYSQTRPLHGVLVFQEDDYEHKVLRIYCEKYYMRKKDRIMSDAIEKYCGDHIDCDLCGLYNDCPYIHRHINPEEVAHILGREIIKNA